MKLEKKKKVFMIFLLSCIYYIFYIISFVCNAKSLTVVIIYFFFFFSTANLDELRTLLAEFSTIVKLDECGLIRIQWKTLPEKYLLRFEILCVKTWHAMCFRENNNGRSKRACKRYRCFS